MSTKTSWAKRCAMFVAAVAAATLMLSVYLATPEHGSVSAGLSHLSQYFTILTNTLVMVVMIRLGCGRPIQRIVLQATVTAIFGVGVLYHLLLAHLWSPQGLSMLVDQGLHTIVPLLSIAWWLVFANPRSARWSDAWIGVAWPWLYVAYALVRAQFSGFYPYPFLDLPELGWPRLVMNIAGISFVFVLLGLTLVGVARLRCRGQANATT